MVCVSNRVHQFFHMLPVLLANSIAADAGLIPGFAIFGPALGLPLSVFAAFLERPFVTRVGFQSSAIWFSLQANFVSLLVGYVATLCVVPFMMHTNVNFGYVWPLVAIVISTLTERGYLEMRLKKAVPFLPIAIGNLISAAACIAVLALAVHLRVLVPELRVTLGDYEMPMNIAVAAASLILLLGSFAAKNPLRGENSPALADY
jgi:hypothetical protein